MNKQQAIEVAKGYFKNHDVDTLFITTDSQAFFAQQSADNHSNGLAKDDREVFEVTRAETEKAKREVVVDLKVLTLDEAKAKGIQMQESAKAAFEEAQAKADAESNHLKKKSLQKAADKAKQQYDAATEALNQLSA